MKILLTIDSGSPGGAEQHVLDIVNAMVANGYEVLVWCRDGVISEHYRAAGAKVTTRAIKRDIDLAYIFALISFLRREKIQIIHAHELRAVGNSLIAGFLSGTKVKISQIHTPFSQWQISKFKQIIYVMSYGIAVRLLSTKEIAVSKASSQIKRKEGIPSNKLAVTLNCVDINKMTLSHNERANYRQELCKKYNLPSDSYIVGNLSRTTAEKGHSILLRAFSQLLSESAQKNLYLIIAGGGELLEQLKNLSKELKIEDRVVFTGKFEDEDKIKLYSSFDCFVFPTLAEGFGIVMLEAMLSELPVICSDLPVLREVAGDNAVFFKFSDVSDLDLRMREVLSFDTVTRQTITNSASKWVEERYSQNKFNETYLKLYEGLLA